MSYIKLMVHSVWATHDRAPILTKDKRMILFNHILENAVSKGIYIDTINGYNEHVHCILSMSADQSISNIMQLIKGEASHWANREKLFPHKLKWAEDYFAASVSEGSLQKARNYVINQEEHHRKITFTEEYEKFIKGVGLQLR